MKPFERFILTLRKYTFIRYVCVIFTPAASLAKQDREITSFPNFLAMINLNA